MDIEELMRQTIIGFFESNMYHYDPFGSLITASLGIVSNDWNDDNVWQDVPDIDSAIESMVSDADYDRHHGLMMPNPYEEVLDWIGNDKFIDFTYSKKHLYKKTGKVKTDTDRVLVKNPPQWFIKLLKYCGVKYTVNTNFQKEYEEAKDEAEEQWEDDRAYNKDPYAYYGVSRSDFV